MKDAQVERPAPKPLPFVSPALHIFAMTGLVFLRTSFGLAMFSPWYIFVALSIAFPLCFRAAKYFSINPYDQYKTVWIYGLTTITLYWLHLGICVLKQIWKKAEDDLYPGTSHFLRLLRLFRIKQANLQVIVPLWIEPGFVLVSALFLFGFSERHYSAWLSFLAFCMFSKEALNFWLTIRKEKVKDDIFITTHEAGESFSAASPSAPIASRKEAVHRPRNAEATGGKAATPHKFAEVLKMKLPYTLAQAESNYRRLVKESPTASAEFDEAIAFFRRRLRRQ